jgi:predicted short-subunit dehydrogenase-like oxidoreductase (DUF2520 family)
MEIKNSRITLIGTGRFAYSFAYALIKNGFNINGVYSRTDSAAQEFAKKFKIKYYGTFDGRIPEFSDVIFLMVPDHSIESLANLIASKNKNLKGRVFIHFSGALSSTVLQSLEKKKALTGSFHIMQTFPSTKRVDISSCYAAVESGNESLLFSLFNFARRLKLKPFRISKEHKGLYHLTGVLTANFLLSHFYNASKLFGQTNIEAVSFFNLFGNITDKTLSNIKSDGMKNSVSGPVIRGDLNIIKDHVKLLKKRKEWLILANYLTESLGIIELLSDKQSPERNLLPLSNYLKKELKGIVKLI